MRKAVCHWCGSQMTRTKEEVEAAALNHQQEYPWDAVLAIWADESGEVLALVHEGWVWTR